MSFLDTLGINKEEFDKASASTVTEGFEPLESGAYPATIKSMILYKNKFDGTQLRVEVELTESKRVLSYRKDVGKLLQDGKVNGGFLSRLKSIAAAVNIDADSGFSIGKEIEFNSFGAVTKGNLLLGAIGKPVIALVRKSEDTDRPENDQYRIGNDIEGVASKDSEDYKTFIEKVEKQEGKPFGYKSGYKPKGAAKNSDKAGSTEAKKELEDVDF